MLVGVPTNHTLEALDGGHVWEVIPGSMDEEVGESEPKGRVSLRNPMKCSLTPPTVAAGTQSFWGSWEIVRNMPQNLQSKDRKSGVNFHPLWVVGCPWGHYHLLPRHTYFWVAPACSWAVSPNVWESPQEEERCRNLKLEAVSVLETVHPLRLSVNLGLRTHDLCILRICTHFFNWKTYN